MGIYLIFGTNFSWNERIDTCLNVEYVLFGRNFDFFGDYLVVTARYVVITAPYCSLVGDYCWLLLVTGGYCLLPLVTGRSHFFYDRLSPAIWLERGTHSHIQSRVVASDATLHW